MKFHPIRKSWDLVFEEEHGVDDTEDIDVGGVEESDIEVMEDVKEEGVENVEADSDVEVIGSVDEGGVSAWPNFATPSSPISGILTDGESLPPTSDMSEDLVDVIDSDDEGVWGESTLKRKASQELGVGTKRWKAVRAKTEVVLDDGSGAETDGGNGLSWSAVTSRRLRESARSGEFVIDERKKKRFEEKCIEMDCGAEFRYQDVGWQVLHSRCSKWFKMSEPYNTTKFKLHVGTCKVKGKGRNASIMSFFKPRDPNDINATEAKVKITVSARKQIFVGGGASTSTLAIDSSRLDNQLVSRTHPCLGISDIQDHRVSTYISRTVVEGAGSISLQKATKQLYSDAKYSELTDNQKSTVTIAQAHLRSWSINRELQVVFSTNCAKFVERSQRPTKTICGNCEKVASSDSFKRALRVKPPPLETMKFIPNKYRNALADLGAKFANIHGLSELLREVSPLLLVSHRKRQS